MKIFAIGDLHLSFGDKVEKPMDIFGEEWVNHAERLKANWTARVGAEDVVIICGDVSWGLKAEEAEADFRWIDSLPGRKAIFKGNHDLWWQSTGKLNSRYGSETLTFVQNNCYILEKDGQRIALCGSRGWICPGDDSFTPEDKKIYERELGRLELSFADAVRQKADVCIGVLHFPPTNDKFQASGFTEIMSKYKVKTCVYGHLHGQESYGKGLSGMLGGVRYRLVSLDYLNAEPWEVEL